jgi:hypothetical protein
MEDKRFLLDAAPETRTSRREYQTTEEWLAPLDREIERLEQHLEENAKLFGLPPLDQRASASSNRR